MKIMIASSRNDSLRADFEGWTEEDSNLFVPNKPIGMTPSPKYESPKNALEALSTGWQLLGPPSKDYCEHTGVFWNWWFIKPSSD